MRLADVLKLPKQPHSLSIIKDFLEQPLSHTDYQAAFSYYFDICLSLEAYDQVFQEGTKVLKEIELQVETPYYEKILKAMIDASFHLSKLDEMKRELIRLNSQRSTGTSLENPKKIYVVKKTIARINTFLNNKPKEVIKKSNE